MHTQAPANVSAAEQSTGAAAGDSTGFITGVAVGAVGGFVVLAVVAAVVARRRSASARAPASPTANRESVVLGTYGPQGTVLQADNPMFQAAEDAGGGTNTNDGGSLVFRHEVNRLTGAFTVSPGHGGAPHKAVVKKQESEV